MTMKPLNRTATILLDTLTAEIELDDGHRRIDRAPGSYMPLVVEQIGPRMYSLAHYGEQNGDLMRDPEMTFWKDPAGRWFPCSYRNDYVGVDFEHVRFADGLPVRYSPRGYRDAARFAVTWLKNIRSQQNLTPGWRAA